MENTNWVGVDTHKNTLACYSRNDFKEFSTTDSGYKKALEWAGENAVFAIEGAYCFGRPFASYLINNKRKVYEINPFITKSCRSALSANGNKNDYVDAKVISIFEELEEVLDEKIRNFNNSQDGFYLFEPESDFDFSRIQKYEFKIITNENNRKQIKRFEGSEFNLSKYLMYQNNPSVETLKNDIIKFIDENNFAKEWSIYECLYGEMEYNERIYILSTEKWFEIDKNKFRRINDVIESIEDDTFTVSEELKEQVTAEILVQKNDPDIKKN